MKKIFLFLLISLELVANLIKAPLLTYDEEKNLATIRVEKVDVGMSGYIVHHLDKDHTSILKDVEVKSFDEVSKIATLKVTPFDGLTNNALPSGNWKVKVGDTVILAFAYTRSVLVAPSEEIYYRIVKSVDTQWLHSDLFATVLSFRGHPTPLKEDFSAMSSTLSVGLVFIYLEQKIYTVDAKTLAILSITDAPLAQDSVQLPFYTRVKEIDKAWWGEGSSELEAYEPHYFELLVQNNKTNKALYNVIKSHGKKYSDLLENFEIKE